jgi:hypothetical protein
MNLIIAFHASAPQFCCKTPLYITLPKENRFQGYAAVPATEESNSSKGMVALSIEALFAGARTDEPSACKQI